MTTETQTEAAPSAAIVPVGPQAVERRMTGDLPQIVSSSSLPGWAQWTIGVLLVAALGALAWAFLHKPSAKAHRRMAASEAHAARRHRQREKRHRAAAKRRSKEEARSRRRK